MIGLMMRLSQWVAQAAAFKWAGLACLLLMSACAGPVHNMQLDTPLGLRPGSYSFAALSPEGSDSEVRARALLATKLIAKGFSPADDPRYSVEIAVSERPSAIGLYAADETAKREDVSPAKPFMGMCNERALRLALVFTERASGRTVSIVRSGQLRCSAGLDEGLPKLADEALAEALR
jgi:hypothetical protein